MEEEKQEAHPVIGEYQGKPIIRIPTVDNPNTETSCIGSPSEKPKQKLLLSILRR